MSRTARALQLFGLAALAAGLPGLDFGALLSWLSAALLLLAALKLIEARSLRERRLVSLLSLVGCGVQGAQQPELLPSLLQLLATSLALAGLLALELGAGLSWRGLLRRSLAVLLAALPVALLLFLLVPRIAPLWQAPSLRGGSAVTGLSATLDPGGIASLANNDAPAARVGFSGDAPPPSEQRYWRVLVHQRFDGQRWLQQEEPPSLHRSQPTEPDPATAPSPTQVWLVEPSPVNALPWAGRGQGSREQLRVNAGGELKQQQPTSGRQAYLLRHTNLPSTWQLETPTLADLALPAARNPQLAALGTSWRSLPTPEQRLAAARAWFSSQGFRYSRSPGALPQQHGLDVFLFERQEGFCGHYASAFTALMRAAGVPARVVSGYLGGRWVQPLGGSPFLELRHSDAHAWSEVWLPERGWQRVDPSAWVGGMSNVMTSETGRDRFDTRPNHPLANSWLWLQRQWWGLDLAWNRWWLGFDRDSQEALLQRLFSGQRQWLGLALLLGSASLLALGLAWLRWIQRRQPGQGDRLARELRRLLRRLSRLGIDAEPGDTIDSLCLRAGRRHPNARATLEALAEHHNQLRYAPLTGAQRQHHWAGWRTALHRLGLQPTKSYKP